MEEIIKLFNKIMLADLKKVRTADLQKWYDFILAYVIENQDEDEMLPSLLVLIQILEQELSRRSDSSPAIERLLLKSPMRVYQILCCYGNVDLEIMLSHSGAFQSKILQKQFINIVNEIITARMTLTNDFKEKN